MLRTRTFRTLLLALLLSGFASGALAQAFNIDFGSAYGTPADTFGGAAGQPGHWNQVVGVLTDLDHLDGSASAVSMTVLTDSFGGTNGAVPSNDTEELLNDNLFRDAANGAWGMTIGSFLPNGRYRVFLYAPSNVVVSSGDLLVEGVEVADFPGDSGSTLIEGTSWVSVDVTIDDGTLNISGSIGSGNSGLAGMQILRLERQSLNVDFGSTSPDSFYGAAAGQPGIWNQGNIGVTNLAPIGSLTLLNISGVSMNLSADSVGSSSEPTDDGRLLADEFIRINGVMGFVPWTIELVGLAPGTYRVYLYAPSDPGIATGPMTVGGIAVPSLPGDPGSTLIQNVSWTMVEVTVTDPILTISGGAIGTTGLAGFQLMAVSPQGLNVDFGYAHGVPDTAYGAAAEQAGYWNEIRTIFPKDLRGVDGAPSGVSLLPEFDSLGSIAGSPTSGDEILLEDHLQAGGWSIDLVGLAPGPYRVYLYAPSAGALPTGPMGIGAVNAPSIPGHPDSALIEGISWLSADVNINSSAKLKITGSGTTRGLAGLQIVPLVATPVKIDFGYRYGPPPDSYAAAGGLTGRWNEAGLGATNLLDLNGDVSGISVHVIADTDNGARPDTQDADDDYLLEDGFEESDADVWWVELAGLAPGDYRVRLYAPSESGVTTGVMSVGGIVVPELLGDPGSNLVEGDSWVSVDVTVVGNSLYVAGIRVGFPTVGLSGLQVTPLPEPGGVLPLAVGMAYLLVVARRRRSA